MKKEQQTQTSVLKEREQTHGNFVVTAACAQKLKMTLQDFILTDSKLSLVQRESLHLICTKLARIVCGDSNNVDHWKDISGYATLAQLELESWQ